MYPPPLPQIVRWTDGGFGMVSHNYDGDMLTDEIAQVGEAGSVGVKV